MKRNRIKIALLLLLLAAVAVLIRLHPLEPISSQPGGVQTSFPADVSVVPVQSLPQSSGLEASFAGPEVSSAAPSSQSTASAGKTSVPPKAVSSASSVPKSSVIPDSQPPRAAASRPPSSTASVSGLMPQASGTSVFSENGATVDYSNSSEGYIMVRYSGSARIKVLVYYNGSSSYYQYNLSGNGAYQTLPLQSGSGFYRVRFMQNLSGSTYAELCSTTIAASVSGMGYALYPNQYVNYTSSSAAAAKARSLCAAAGSNAKKVAAIYSYITSTIKYDYDKAASVTSGYLPNVDATLSSRKGICFDYAALMAAMCRSQRIPTRLVIGNTSKGYHAWNEVYLNGWVRYDPTFAAAGQTAGTYTPQKYY